MEQRALNCCVRVLLVCEYRRWQRVSVAMPALSPGIDACRRILNHRDCAIGHRSTGGAVSLLATRSLCFVLTMTFTVDRTLNIQNFFLPPFVFTNALPLTLPSFRPLFPPAFHSLFLHRLPPPPSSLSTLSDSVGPCPRWRYAVEEAFLARRALSVTRCTR